MGAKPSNKQKLKPSIISLLLFSLIVLLTLHLTLNFFPSPNLNNIHHLQENDHDYHTSLKWYNMVIKGNKTKKVKVGLVNMDDIEEIKGQSYDQLRDLSDNIMIKFDRIDENLKWNDFFPEWIDEEEKWGKPSCPKIPMPELEKYGQVNVVVARVPCGVRDVFRLQVNLLVANLLVRSGWEGNDMANRTVYAVFVGECGPMREIFRCDDMLWHEGKFWVYKPDLKRLKQKVLMPFGSCQLVPPFAQPESPIQKPKEAYVTVLHTSEAYVCGAIALAQSLIQSNTTKDLILLADNSISLKSLQGLRASGWNTRRINRIRSPYSGKNAYNEWNYSKLRIFELTDYDKVIFIDADLIVLQKIDSFFTYPQLTASGNDKYLFNSGIMLIEPSQCTFNTLMENRHEVASYNGGDQGFLNEMFTWWHRWPGRLNHMKIFEGEVNKEHTIPDNVYAIHYLGLKPWMCYMDYDCNWDMPDHHIYASDKAHHRWWQVYKAMPKQLQSHCALNKAMDVRIRKWRRRAKMDNLQNGHWKIKVRDPRRNYI